MVALRALPGYRNEPASFLPYVLRVAAQKVADLRRADFHRRRTEPAAHLADATSGDGIQQSIPGPGMVELLTRAFAS